MIAEFPCRVCSLDQGDDQWNPPTFFICDCCGTEFGLTDRTLEQVHAGRMDWLINGAQWFDKKYQPESWQSIEDLAKQLKNIPFEWW